MLLFLSASILFVASLLPAVSAQDDTQIDGAQNDKVAITGAIIGAVLVVLALVAVGVYGIERCLSRRRAKSARSRTKFTPLPTQLEGEPHQYLSTLPPAIRLPKNGRDSHYSVTTSSPLSPNARGSSYGRVASDSPARSPGAQSVQFDPYGHGPFYPVSSDSPVRSPGAQSVRFDPYGHGPFYPGCTSSPPASPNALASSPREPPLPSHKGKSFRKDSQNTLYSSSASQIRSTTPSSSSLRGSEARTVTSPYIDHCSAAHQLSFFLAVARD
ncbi:hypothetical protein DFH07DRAFT_278875 [Mycena maculata]|uniref:Uncharacterized protein n=1 Tax=Mycena maculata TaxID=230809 RepID=A0AAD7HM88_9AGAR|nr:hypothetical protein DFH07DRAFT_278875 [Mycena maculata]